MLQTTFTFDSEETLKEIYALSALRAHIHRQRGQLGLFTADQRLGLEMALEGAFCNIAARLIPYSTSFTAPLKTSGSPAPSGLYTLTLSLPDEFPSALNNLLRKAIGVAIAFETMRLGAVDGSDRLAAEYGLRADNSVENALKIIKQYNSAELRIIANW